MSFEPTMTEELLLAIEADKDMGAVAPKLLRLESAQSGDASSSDRIIDSMGITSDRSHRFWNRGEGEVDRGQYDNTTPFGLAGTAVLFRREALNDIAANGGGKRHEYCDEDFVAYKDDVDVSYRLRHRGWNIAIAPKAVAYHQRTAREEKSVGLLAGRRKKSFRIRGNSLRNHWFCLIKNEPAGNLLRAMPWIFWYECRKLVFVVFCEPSTLRILPSTWRLLMRMLRKRSAILGSSQISHRTLRGFFTHNV
jgi:GT2 family glycosyltransferase